MAEKAKIRSEVRLSQLPVNMHQSTMDLVKELDTDGDGAINVDEFVAAVTSLVKERSTNRNLTKVVTLLSVATFLLIGAMFGVSIVAARLAKDTQLGANGMLEDKHTGSVVKTGEALFEYKTNILDMNASQLMEVKKLTFLDGEMQFDVMGYAKSSAGDQVMMIVQGGTVTFDKKGISDATDSAKLLIDLALDMADSDDRRKLLDKVSGDFTFKSSVKIIEESPVSEALSEATTEAPSEAPTESNRIGTPFPTSGTSGAPI